MFLAGNVDLIGFQLTLELNRRSPISAIQIVRRRCGRVATRGGRSRTGFLVREGSRSHLFDPRNLVFHFTNIRMTICVVREEIGELRFELLELLIQSGYSHRCAVPTLGRSLQSTRLCHHRLQVSVLLPVGVETIFFVLQLGLESGQDLEIACQLCRQLSEMLIFVYTDLFFLLGQILPCGLQLLFEKLGGVFRFLLPRLQILADKQIGQLTRDLLRDVRIVSRIIRC